METNVPFHCIHGVLEGCCIVCSKEVEECPSPCRHAASLSASEAEVARLRRDNEMIIANCFTMSEVEEIFIETGKELWRRKSRRAGGEG